ncbi:hypothetical protein GCM10023166_20200 [Paeniglutamicibacter cryotolerans]
MSLSGDPKHPVVRIFPDMRTPCWGLAGPLTMTSPACRDAAALQTYLRWRNAHGRSPEVLDDQRRDRARVRSEKDTVGDGTMWPGQPEKSHRTYRSQH